MPFLDFTYRNGQPKSNYFCCGPLIWIPHISVFLRDLPSSRIGTRLASYCYLGDLLRRPVFRGVVNSNPRFELHNSALALEQVCNIRNRLSCLVAWSMVMRAQIKSQWSSNSFSSVWLIHYNKLMHQNESNSETLTSFTYVEFHIRCHCAWKLKNGQYIPILNDGLDLMGARNPHC